MCVCVCGFPLDGFLDLNCFLLWNFTESVNNHLKEMLLDQVQARAPCIPPFWGSFRQHTPMDDIRCPTSRKILNLGDNIIPQYIFRI